MYGLIEVAADKSSNGIFSWEQTLAALRENPYKILHNLRAFIDNTQEYNIQGPKVQALKDRFIVTSSQQAQGPRYIEIIREFLCEGFCFIDILDEINLLKSPEKRGNRSSFPIDTSMQQFASPSSEVHRVGIDVNMISPIPTRGDQYLGGVSVNRYVDVSQDQTQVQRSPNKDAQRSPPKRWTQYEATQIHDRSDNELNRSKSPSRDLVR